MRIYIKCTFFILLMTFSFSINAFDYNKCKKFLKKNQNWFLGITTSGQSTTSTGECALIGSRENLKKMFISHNIENMIINSSQGDGEYILAYSNYFDCKSLPEKYLGSLFQKEFKNLFGNEGSNSPDQVFVAIENLYTSDIVLSNNCSS